MIADRLRANIQGFYDYFERTSVGDNWDTSSLTSASIVDGQLVLGTYDVWWSYKGAIYTGVLNLDRNFEINLSFDFVEANNYVFGHAGIALRTSDGTHLIFAGMGDHQGSTGGFYSANIDSYNYGTADGTLGLTGTIDIKIKRVSETVSIYLQDNLVLSEEWNYAIERLDLVNDRHPDYTGIVAKFSYITVKVT